MFTSCKSTNNLTTPESSIVSNPKILFLNYSIKKSSSEARSVLLINKIITKGKFKKNNNLKDAISGDLIGHQLDKNSNVLQDFIIKNPLIKNIEYIDGSNSFQIKKIVLDSAEFSLRLQLKPNTKYITISNFNDPKKENDFLIKTEIN